LERSGPQDDLAWQDGARFGCGVVHQRHDRTGGGAIGEVCDGDAGPGLAGALGVGFPLHEQARVVGDPGDAAWLRSEEGLGELGATLGREAGVEQVVEQLFEQSQVGFPRRDGQAIVDHHESSEAGGEAGCEFGVVGREAEEGGVPALVLLAGQQFEGRGSGRRVGRSRGGGERVEGKAGAPAGEGVGGFLAQHHAGDG
jgi:hypothetical protein